MKPVVYDFFCGLFGWGAAFLSQGYRVVGFDIADMHAEIGLPRPREVELVLQDVRSIHGSQCKDAAVLVASPPCQKYSYMAMPWKRAKALAAWYRESAERIAELNALFDACFRIQREASEAAGRHIPLIVENVQGAQPWVGRAQWHFGSFYLWGDIPALMPIPARAQKFNPDGTGHPPGSWFAIANSKNRGQKAQTKSWSDFAKTGEVSPHWRMEATKNDGGSWFNIAHNTESGVGQNPDGRKVSGDCFGSYEEMKAAGTISPGRLHGKDSVKRKAASAAIAKIPFPLAQHVAQCFKEVRA
jgi:C-5 cytosine-specific DNA methylase